MGRLLHFACGGSQAAQGPRDLLAVRLSLVEKHPYQIIQKYPGRQTKQPLKKRESYMTCIVGWFSLKLNESCLFQMMAYLNPVMNAIIDKMSFEMTKATLWREFP